MGIIGLNILAGRMKFKNIHVIINPGSGKKEPILSYLNKSFIEAGLNWNLTVSKPDEQVYDIAKSLLDKADLIAIYGGDGSVTQAARALQGTGIPLAIIPGGTANVLAKELGLPHDSLDALQLISSEQFKVIAVDMATANDKCFILRINFGILADMILDANLDLKDRLGQVAYGVTALEAIHKAEPVMYKMTIDGKEIVEEGVALTITNAGNIGVGDYSFLPDISITDGCLDVILLKDTNLFSLVKVAGSTLLQTDSDVLMHWKCKKFSLSMPDRVKYICDDCEEEAKEININVLPAALNVLVPLNYVC